MFSSRLTSCSRDPESQAVWTLAFALPELLSTTGAARGLDALRTLVQSPPHGLQKFQHQGQKASSLPDSGQRISTGPPSYQQSPRGLHLADTTEGSVWA